MSSGRLYSMKEAERRTGLSAHLLRVWERRYAAVTPERSDSQQRLYTESEIERLKILGSLTQAGMTISRIAKLSLEELQVLEQSTVAAVSETRGTASPAAAAQLLEKSLFAVRHYDCSALEKTLDYGMITFGYSGLLETLLIPLLHEVGNAWERGELTTSQEHAATACIKDYLARHLPDTQPPKTSPRLLVTTPAGQFHEIGAVIAAGLARKAGWNVTFLGSSLPAEEIAGAARSLNCRAVALSLVYPMDDPALPGQLRRLRQLLPPGLPLIVGGRAVPGYRPVLEEIGALILTRMSEFTPLLREVRDLPFAGQGTASPDTGPTGTGIPHFSPAAAELENAAALQIPTDRASVPM